jgi:hypothetical protein
MGLPSCSGWMPQFVSKIAPPFVSRAFEMRAQSSVRFEWVAAISMLPCARKLFEKIILTRLVYKAERYEILSSTQYGFRKGRGTRNCVALLSTAIQSAFERK